MNRRTLLAGSICGTLCGTLYGLLGPASAHAATVCIFTVPQPEPRDQWDRHVINKNPSHVEVDTKTAHVRYHFADGRQATIDALAESPPDPRYGIEKPVHDHLWKMARHYYDNARLIEQGRIAPSSANGICR